MKKEDIRIKKTKQLIKEAIIHLVKQKGYKKVSVTDIVNYAQINRNTFYLHYEDKEDLIKKLMSESAAKINAILRSYILLPFTIENVKEVQIRMGIRSLLKLIKPDIDFYQMVLLDESLSGYINKLYDVLKGFVMDWLHIQNPRSNLVFEYASNGMIGSIQQWILYYHASEATMAKLLAKLSYGNLQQFKEINIIK